MSAKAKRAFAEMKKPYDCGAPQSPKRPFWVQWTPLFDADFTSIQISHPFSERPKGKPYIFLVRLREETPPMTPFESFTDAEITARLSIPMIVDAFWTKEYGLEVEEGDQQEEIDRKQAVSWITREVGCSLMYLVRKYGALIPHWLLLQAVSEHTDLSESTIGPFIKDAEKRDMITIVTPETDGRERLYGFTAEQKKKILRASAAVAYAAALAMEQAKQPTNTEFGKTSQNESYYRHIFNRINTTNEAIMKKLAKLQKRLAWVIPAAIGLALWMYPCIAEAATWSTGNT
jgi:DNA-binding MarR family transcriptional regulator